jgi:hypothetical protein
MKVMEKARWRRAASGIKDGVEAGSAVVLVAAAGWLLRIVFTCAT